MPILNQKDFENAKRDIDDIGKSVNTDAIINPRWGGLFESIPRLSRIASQKIEDWQTAINLITINDGVPALAVSDASGKNQQEINNNLEVFIFPQNHGAKFDGITDISQALRQSAVEAKSKNATIVLTGKAFIGSTVDIDCNIDGRGAEIITPNDSTFDVFNVKNPENKVISGLNFTKQSETSSRRGVPIKISGAAKNITIRDVFADGYKNTVAATNEADPTINAKFKVNISNTATGGVWQIGFPSILSMGVISWTPTINHTATVQDVQAAIDGALGVGATAVTSSGDGGYFIEFIGSYAGCYIPQPYLSYALTGTVMYGSAVDIISHGGMQFIEGLKLDNVNSINAGEYGFSLGAIDGLEIIGCSAKKSYFDGIKFIKFVRNVNIVGGNYSFNGLSFFNTGSSQSAGDGIDMYAGGENVKVIGGFYNFNHGLGIQIKNDDDSDLSGYKVGKYGMCRNLEFIGVEASFNSAIGGLGLTTNKSGNTSYSVTDVKIIGGRYEGNAVYGIGINGGQRVTITDASCNRNGRQGVVVTQYSKHVDINNCTAVANGSNVYNGVGLQLDGSFITVNGGRYIGCDTDGLTVSTDYDSLPKVHRTNIQVAATASDVLINTPHESHNASGRGIQVSGTPPRVVIHQKPTEILTPNSSSIFGDVGSTIQLKDGRKFEKLTGNVSTGVWRSVGVVSSNLNASATVSAASDIYIVRATSADVVATLPLASTCIGLSTKFILYSVSNSYTASVTVQAGDAINGRSDPVVMNASGSLVEVTATSVGWIVTTRT